MKLQDFRVHPACAAFPLLEGDDLRSLAQDIRDHGLLEPVTVDGDELLDGRNRLRACEAVGVTPHFRQWKDRGQSKTAWIVSVNIHRRHLSSSQRAMLAVDLLPALAEEAKERQRKAAATTNRPQLDIDAVRQKVAQAPPDDRKAAAVAGAAVGVNRTYVQQASRLQSEAPDVAARVRSGELNLSKARHELKQRAKQEQAAEIDAEPKPLPAGPFRVIVADPPWRYDDDANVSEQRGRTPYATMTDSDILALPVADLAHDDAVLWLWTTNAHMPLAFRCLDAWEFTHKSILTWVKPRWGVGRWLRGQTEHCLLAVKGAPPTPVQPESTLLNAPLGAHSRKPDEFYALVERCCPGSKVELFAREQRAGWQAWGHEA